MSDLPVPVDAIPALSVGPFTATPIGLIIAEEDVPYEIWEAYGGALRRVESAIQFVLGDWLYFGDRAYGEKYTQALVQFPDYKMQRLLNYAWVAGAVEISTRVEVLDWTHHREVAKLEPELQRYWLGRAAYEDDKPWSTRKLEAAIREAAIEERKRAYDDVAVWARAPSSLWQTGRASGADTPAWWLIVDDGWPIISATSTISIAAAFGLSLDIGLFDTGP